MDRFFRLVIIISFFTMAILFFYRNTLPPVSLLDASLKKPPLQTKTYTSPFYVKAGAHNFYIEPLYDYKIQGLVVTKYNARQAFLAREDKKLNVVDVCVVWGNNALQGYYKQHTFYSGEWTCYITFSSQVEANIWRAIGNERGDGLRNEQLSNNHLIVEGDRLAERLRNIQIGEQIYIEGYLARYGLSANEIYRSSSTTRTDFGNGACETIYVTRFETIHSNIYRTLFNISAVIFLLITAGGLLYYFKTYSRRVVRKE